MLGAGSWERKRSREGERARWDIVGGRGDGDGDGGDQDVAREHTSLDLFIIMK